MTSDPTCVGVHETILRAQVALCIRSGHSYVTGISGVSGYIHLCVFRPFIDLDTTESRNGSIGNNIIYQGEHSDECESVSLE
jgi:hypothetical protein